MTNNLHVSFQEYLYQLCSYSTFMLNILFLQHYRDLVAKCIIQLQFHNSSALIGHAGPHIQLLLTEYQPRAVGLVAHKVGEILAVVHVIEQLVIAGTSGLKDAHAQPVLIDVVVKGHREHDGHQPVDGAVAHVDQLIGHDPHSTGCCVVILDEGTHLRMGGADSWLWRAEGETTFHMHPAGGRGWMSDRRII